MINRAGAFLAAALAVRLLGLNAASLWFDEAVSKYRASLPLARYFVDMSDYTGANLWELILRPFAGGPVWLLRIPALLASLGVLWLAWHIMYKLEFTSTQRITAALPMILLPGLIWQAQDARYYAAISLLYMAAIWYAISQRPAGLFACLGLLIYVHPVGPAYALGALLIAWTCGTRIRHILIIGALAFVAWIPRLSQMVTTALGESSFWLASLSTKFILEQMVQSFFVNTLKASWLGWIALTLLMYVAIAGVFRIQNKAVRIAWLAAIVPVIGLLCISVIKPVYFYRPIQPIAIPFCLLIGLTLMPTQGWTGKVAPVSGLAILAISLAAFNPAVRGGYADQGAALIRRGWHSGDRIMYAALNTALPFGFYLQDLDHCMIPHSGMDELPAELAATFPDCSGPAAGGTWLIWPRDPTMDPILTEELASMTKDVQLAWRSDAAWQIAPNEIYYLPKVKQ